MASKFKRKASKAKKPAKRAVKPAKPKAPTLDSIQSRTDLAWVDMISPLTISKEGASLKAGGFAKCDVRLIPEPVWDQHEERKASYTSATDQKLEASPDVIGLYRGHDGVLGALIGYKAKKAA